MRLGLRTVLTMVFGIVGLGFAGCINMSTLQTAETLKPGDGRMIIGGGYYTSPAITAAIKDSTEEAAAESEDVAETAEALADLKVPYAEIGYRYGLFDRFDVGAKLTLIGTIALDAKYQFLDAGAFDMATGLALGYVDIESSSGSGETLYESKSRIIDVILPVYTSVRLAKAFALYLSPKGVYRQITNTTIDGTVTSEESSSSTMVGGTAGLMLGDTWGMALEGTYFKDTKSDFDMVQVAGALFF